MSQEIRNTLIRRVATERGVSSSLDENAGREEVYRLLSTLIHSYNTYLYPICSALPSRQNTSGPDLGTTSVTDPTDIDVVAHGLDGTQVYTDNDAANGETDVWTGSDYDPLFYVGTRPKSIKESFVHVLSLIDSLYESYNSLANDTSSSSSSSTDLTSSVLGNLTTITNNINQLANDFYKSGSTSLSGDGSSIFVKTADDRMDDIEADITTLDTLLNTTGLENSHIKSSAAISSSKIAIAAPTEYTGVIDSLQTAINRIITVISVLAHNSGSFSSWDSLPTVNDTGNGASPLGTESLSDHINNIGQAGSAGTATNNPHGLTLPDCLAAGDTVAYYTTLGVDEDLKPSFIRDDADELLEVSAAYYVYTRDTLGRMSTKKKYTDSGMATMFYQETYTYDGTTDRITRIDKIDYHNDNRIAGADPVVTREDMTYDVNGYLTTRERVIIP